MKRETKATRNAALRDRLYAAGFTWAEQETLRLAEKTLHRWSEAECNGEIQRDETTGKPRRYYGRDMDKSYPTADREKGALKRIAAVMEARNERDKMHAYANQKLEAPFVSYYQTDCRGCALYIVPVSALNGQDIHAVYNRGIAISFE